MPAPPRMAFRKNSSRRRAFFPATPWVLGAAKANQVVRRGHIQPYMTFRRFWHDEDRGKKTSPEGSVQAVANALAICRCAALYHEKITEMSGPVIRMPLPAFLIAALRTENLLNGLKALAARSAPAGNKPRIPGSAPVRKRSSLLFHSHFQWLFLQAFRI